MSETIRLSPSLKFLLSSRTKPRTDFYASNHSTPAFRKISLPTYFLPIHFPGKISGLHCWSGEGSLQAVDAGDDFPVAVELQPICSESQFDRVLAEAQQLEDSIIIIWMANWCRKCIYLKPKLEKLAADYYPRLQFYCVDVNNIPHKLVSRAGVTKMPTIQLWKDGNKQFEVIGGHKAYLVINEVRQMIENEDAL